MKKYRYTPFFLSIIILVISIMAVGDKAAVDKSEKIATADQTAYYMKGIWVSYITLDMQSSDKSEATFIKKIESIVNKTKESGFNTLIFQVRPFSDALYKSSYYPWSHILTGSQGVDPQYDPLEIICDICHENNIKVHAWINPYRVATSDTPKKLSEDNPYTKDKSIGFEYSDAIYLDPSDKNAQELIVNGVSEIVRNYDVDGIQFDDYFYPENSDEVDDSQYNKYKKSTPNPLSKEKWRKENVNTLFKQVHKTVHKYSDGIVFGVSPQGNLNNNDALGADVITWCENEGYIDYICPQIYFSLDNPALTFEDSLSQWLKINTHDCLQMYIGLAGYKGGTDEDGGTWLDNDDILRNEIEICEQKGLDGIMLYSFESLISKENKSEIQNVVQYLTGVKQ